LAGHPAVLLFGGQPPQDTMDNWSTNEEIAFVIDDRLAKINDMLDDEHCGWCWDLLEGKTSHTTDAIRMMLEGMGDREIADSVMGDFDPTPQETSFDMF
jgi:hypothetical protein